ncbi:MAG: ABC transporter ATP-binding protein [Leptolyngbyaceae cyanobacterium]
MASPASDSLKRRFWVTLSTTPKLLKLVWQAAPRWLLLSLGATVTAALLPVAWLYINKLIIDGLAASLSIGSPAWQRLALLVTLRFALAMLKSGLENIRPYISLVISDRFSLFANQQLLQQAIRLDLEHYESSQFHESLSRAMQSGSSYPVRAFNNFTMILGQSINLLGVVGLLAQFNPIMVGLLFLTSLPPLRIGVTYSNKGFSLMRKQTLNNRVAAYFQGLLTQQPMAKEVRLYGLGPYLMQQWYRISQEHHQKMNRLMLRRTTARFVVGLIPSLGFYAGYIWVLIQTVTRQITLGDFTMYAGAFSQSQSLLTNLVENISTAYEANLYVSQYLDFLQLQPKITSPAQPTAFPAVLGEGICFERVSFTYPQASRSTLRDIDLTIYPGESMALVGVNGVGKTTLVKLLTRLYSPSAGRITIDGYPLEAFDLNELRQKIAVLFQDFAHYKLSVAENIGLGDVAAIADRDRIVQAAKAAGADAWIRQLPEGYDTKLGNLFPHGQELSGGQWQKLGLARAFMSRAPILILDEPTAAMDAIAEMELFQRFRELTQERTTIFTSHRFSSVRQADRVMVLDQGRVTELGSHDELMQQDGLYAQMFRLQAEGYQI